MSLPEFSDSESDNDSGNDDRGVSTSSSGGHSVAGAMSKYLEMQLPGATDLNFKLREYSSCLFTADAMSRAPLYSPSADQIAAAASMCGVIREHVQELIARVVKVTGRGSQRSGQELYDSNRGQFKEVELPFWQRFCHSQMLAQYQDELAELAASVTDSIAASLSPVSGRMRSASLTGWMATRGHSGSVDDGDVGKRGHFRHRRSNPSIPNLDGSPTAADAQNVAPFTARRRVSVVVPR